VKRGICVDYRVCGDYLHELVGASIIDLYRWYDDGWWGGWLCCCPWGVVSGNCVIIVVREDC